MFPCLSSWIIFLQDFVEEVEMERIKKKSKDQLKNKSAKTQKAEQR